jgi:hypothetical protein
LRKALKVLAYIGGGLVALALVGAICVYIVS